MTLKIRLEPSPGCGAPPTFRLRPTDTLDSILEWELQEVLASVNGWIASNWTGWGCSNFGWFFGCCCLVRFVRNDLLLREPLAEYVERIAEVMKISSMTLTVSRKVKSKGYGETSETVVKVRLIAIPVKKDPSFESNCALLASRKARRRSMQLARLKMRGDEAVLRKGKEEEGNEEEEMVLIPRDDDVVGDVGRHLWVVRDEGSASTLESDSVRSNGQDETFDTASEGEGSSKRPNK